VLPLGRVVRWAPLAVGSLALLVFLLWYWNPAYRYDEYLVAVARTQLSWGDLFRVITEADPAAGPLYLLMKPWTALSSDPWWTRLPSVIAMAIAVGALVALIQASVNARAAVFAGLLLITLPVISRWAQDNRMYAPATACAVLAVLSWWRWVAGGSRRWSVAYGAAVVGMGLFHLYALTVIPALVLAALWMPGPRRSTLLRTIVPPAIALIVLLPHIYLNISNPTGSPSNPAVSLRSVVDLVDAGGRWITVAAGLLAVAGSVWAWRFRERRALVALGMGWVLIPFVSFVGVRAVSEIPTLASRYYVFALPGACVLAALGLEALFRFWRPGAIVGLGIVAALALPGQVSVRSPGSHDVNTFRLGLLLRQPELAGLPVVAATRTLELIVDASTYPVRVITPPTAAAQPVVVVVTRDSVVNAGIPYRYADSSWRPVLQCTLGGARERRVVLEVVAMPGAGFPAGDADTLARQLNAAISRSRCVAVPPG